MIITDKFVFLHLPKTGGTFVTKVLEKIHLVIESRQPIVKPLFKNLMMPNIKRLHSKQEADQHGTYEQIPEEYKNKPIITVTRNPFDRYVSAYEFREWVRNPPADEENILTMYPNFPNLNFEQFLDFSNSIDIKYRPHSSELQSDIGVLTFQFIQMFFINPSEIIKKFNDDYIASTLYKADMPQLTFLKMENLNFELYQALLKFGYLENDVGFILNEQKVLPAGSIRSYEQKWEKYYTQKLREYVKHKERFLFKLFHEYR